MTNNHKQLYSGLEWLGTILPGMALAVFLAWLGVLLSEWIGKSLMGLSKSPISAIMVTIILGLLVRNTIGLPEVYEKGLRLTMRKVLRIGIALLGLRLSLTAVGQIGISALPVVVGCIVSALIMVSLLGRALGLPPRLATLIAVGTSICGASAIVATGPAIDAEEDEVSYAVACITLFGTIALLTYPYLGHWLFDGNTTQVGLFLGTAIHDTSQVVGAGLMYQQHFDAPTALNVAATTKLVRNVCMGVVIPLMAILYHNRNRSAKTGGAASWFKYVPFFVIAFVVLASVRSVGDLGGKAFGILDPEIWKGLLSDAKAFSVACLTIAMAAIGLGTSIKQLKILGWKPMLVGLVAAVLVGGVSIGLVKFFVMFS